MSVKPRKAKKVEEETPKVETIKEPHTGAPPPEPLPETPIIAVTTEEKLLLVYANAPLGPMNIEQIAEQLSITEEKCNQAWDRLYDFGKLPFSKFVKQ